MAYLREDAADSGRDDSVAAELTRAIAAARQPRERLLPASCRAVESFPEIDCIRHRLSPAVVAAAERRAAALNVGVDEVLVASGHISAEWYSRVLAFSLGVRFAELDSAPRTLCPLSDAGLLLAAKAGMLLVVIGGELALIVAPRGLHARRLVGAVQGNAALRRRILISTPEHIARFVQRHGRPALASHAAERLREAHPAYSAASRSWRLPAVVAAVVGVCGAALAAAPAMTVAALQLLVSTVFLAWTGLRLVGALQRPLPERAAPLPGSDRELPTYTVVVALYRESQTVAGLIRALRALDYPPEKLQVLLILEADDPQTRLAVERAALAPHFRIVFAPAVNPRTKPKALNVGLLFARGDYIVIYDAEDRPEPDQLRRAVSAFRADSSGRLACVQARLSIDNTATGWLAAWFAAEYAGQFDVLLPGLASLELPIPLGGSSNHFAAAALRAAAGWDAYNVTEDADLGTRLARLGYRTQVIASTTHEEAPAKLIPWLRQRTRWFKGWLQTSRVHMRRPLRLWRELRPAGFATFQLMLAGTVLAALLQPVAVLLLVGVFAFGVSPYPEGFDNPALGWLHVIALTSGYAASVILAFIGLARRRQGWIMWLLPLVLVHWALLSIAAWRAVFQFWRDPYSWEKTEHVLSRTHIAPDARGSS